MIATHTTTWLRAARFAFPTPCSVGGISCPIMRTGITIDSN
jgi:hypothetical protein